MPFRLVQITDTHLRARPSLSWGVDVDAGLAAVLAAVRARGADALLLTGDLVHDEGEAAYARLRGLIAATGLPALCLPGNHDDATRLAACCDDTGPLRLARAIALGGWRLVALDSSVPGEPGGALGDAELARLAAQLEAHPATPTLVALHHPPLAIGSPWLDTMMLADADALFAVLARHRQVRAVAFGHIHQQFEAEHGGLRLLAAPSTCVQFRPGTAEPETDPLPPGYRWLDLHPDGRFETGVARV